MVSALFHVEVAPEKTLATYPVCVICFCHLKFIASWLRMAKVHFFKHAVASKSSRRSKRDFFPPQDCWKLSPSTDPKAKGSQVLWENLQKLVSDQTHSNGKNPIPKSSWSSIKRPPPFLIGFAHWHSADGYEGLGDSEDVKWHLVSCKLLLARRPQTPLQDH